MLYTKKGIEKLIADLVAKYITKHGARVYLDDNNYSSSVHVVHFDLLLPDNRKIIIYKTRDEIDGFHFNDCGICRIGCLEYKPNRKGNRIYYRDADAIDNTIITLYHYKDVYTDNKDDYESMKSKGDFRYANKPLDGAFFTYHIKYNPDTILKVLKNHRGYKRLKANDIIRVDKVKEYYRKYYIIHIVGKEPIRVYFKN